MVQEANLLQTVGAVCEHLSDKEGKRTRLTELDFELMYAMEFRHISTGESQEEIDLLSDDELLDFVLEALQEEATCLTALGQ